MKLVSLFNIVVTQIGLLLRNKGWTKILKMLIMTAPDTQERYWFMFGLEIELATFTDDNTEQQ